MASENLSKHTHTHTQLRMHAHTHTYKQYASSILYSLGNKCPLFARGLFTNRCLAHSRTCLTTRIVIFYRH